MTLTIELSPEAERDPREQAERRGITLDEYARALLEQEAGGRPETTPRVFGTHRGRIRISEDFDDPLPERFRSGEA